MGRVSKRTILSRPAAALGATQKRRRLDASETESQQIESQMVQVQEVPGYPGTDEEEEDGREEKEHEEEGEGERENEYLQSLSASHSLPSNPEGTGGSEPENQPATMRDPTWPRVVGGNQARIELLKSGKLPVASYHSKANRSLIVEHRTCGHEGLVILETNPSLRSHSHLAPTSGSLHESSAIAPGTRYAKSHPKRIVRDGCSVCIEEGLRSCTTTIP
jgi:hypothetical protein